MNDDRQQLPTKSITTTIIHTVLAGLLLAANIGPSAASQTTTQRVLVLAPLKTLRQYIDQGQIAEAHSILEALTLAIAQEGRSLKITPQEWIELEFLRGRLAAAEGNLNAAVTIFENILSRYPDIARVRLELGLALYNLKQDQRARYQFDLALQATLPPKAIERVESVKDAIYHRRKWQVRTKIAIVPDSNINAATDDRTVSLFGLPFTLNEDATEQSGIGGLAEFNVTHTTGLGKQLTLVNDASVRRIEYRGSRFDDTIVSFYSGPQYRSNISNISLRFGGFRRWFGEGGFNKGAGGQLAIFRRIGRKWAAGVNSSLFWVDYDQLPARNGFSVQAEPFVVRSVGASGQIRAHITYSQDFAKEKNQASVTHQYGLSFQRELSWDIRLGLNAALGTRRFQAAQLSFGVRRQDEFYSAGLNLAFRKIQILGAALELSYQFQKADSNVTLFSYIRHRFEAGLKKEF